MPLRSKSQEWIEDMLGLHVGRLNEADSLEFRRAGRDLYVSAAFAQSTDQCGSPAACRKLVLSHGLPRYLHLLNGCNHGKLFERARCASLHSLRQFVYADGIFVNPLISDFIDCLGRICRTPPSMCSHRMNVRCFPSNSRLPRTTNRYPHAG